MSSTSTTNWEFMSQFSPRGEWRWLEVCDKWKKVIIKTVACKFSFPSFRELSNYLEMQNDALMHPAGFKS